MSHLVAPIMSQRTLADCHHHVKTAHDYLTQRGAIAIECAPQYAGSSTWGTDIKRLRVTFPEYGRPENVQSKGESHNLTEVMNQCATMERLLDTLVWAQTDQSGLAQFDVERCHPTTSSTKAEGKKMSGDNDLVLVDPNGHYARFEIFDVVSDQPNNNKEKKGLISLDVWREVGDQESGIDWPPGRRFLVVSQELAPFLRRAKRPWLRYIEIPITEWTCIFEIKSIDV